MKEGFEAKMFCRDLWLQTGVFRLSDTPDALAVRLWALGPIRRAGRVKFAAPGYRSWGRPL